MINTSNKTLVRMLYVEDDIGSADACNNSAEIFNEENDSFEIKIENAPNVANAKKLIRDKQYDAIILDLKLDSDSIEDGESVLNFVKENHRIPVAIFSGTPSTAIPEIGVQFFMRGEAAYSEIFRYLINSLNNTIYSVIGQNGALDKLIRRIFWERIIKDPLLSGDNELQNDESLLMRQIVVHLQNLTTQSDDAQHPVDMYFRPFDQNRINTGTILVNIDSASDTPSYNVVLSPPCDLTLRNGHFKTPCIVICPVIEFERFYCERIIRPDSKNNSKEIKDNIHKLVGNNFSHYAHWLWPVGDFQGGVIDFRDISSQDEEMLQKTYSVFPYAIQESYMKNVLRRFASCYNRQGQPDIKSKVSISSLKKRIEAVVSAPQNSLN